MDNFSFFMIFNVVIHVKIGESYLEEKNFLRNEIFFNFPQGMTLQGIRFLELLISKSSIHRVVASLRKETSGMKYFMPRYGHGNGRKLKGQL